jgi:hypothetical protein
VVGVKPRDQNEESWNLKKQRKKLFNTFEKITSQLKIPSKKKAQEKWMMKNKKLIKTICKNHQISNFSNWTMNMCVCMSVCALKDWIDDERTMA